MVKENQLIKSTSSNKVYVVSNVIGTTVETRPVRYQKIFEHVVTNMFMKGYYKPVKYISIPVTIQNMARLMANLNDINNYWIYCPLNKITEKAWDLINDNYKEYQFIKVYTRYYFYFIHVSDCVKVIVNGKRMIKFIATDNTYLL